MKNNLTNFLELITRVKSDARPSVFKLASIYTVAFITVFTVLNFSIVTDSLAFMRNKFTDYDEVLETELLMAAYRGQEPILISTNPQSKPVFEKNNQLTYSDISTDKNSILIPKINVKAPMIVGNSTDISKILKDLESGVLVYPGSAMPGQGSTVIVGHSSSNKPWNKYSNIFSLLNRLQVGDLIYVNYENERYVYQVNIKKTGSVFTLASSGITGDLILSSCWPAGTDNGRILISASLLK